MDFRNRQDLTKGIRNNNPGNIRDYGIEWDGLAQHVFDNGMCIFEDMTYGIRAWLMCYHADVVKHGIKTVSDYVTKYAPANENNTGAYISLVCNDAGLNPGDSLPTAKDKVVAIFKAQAHMENGKDAALISDDDIQKAVQLFEEHVPNWLS